MPSTTLTKANVAVLQELCAGVAEIGTADPEDNFVRIALHQVKEEAEQMLWSRTRPNGPLPRRTYEQDREGHDILPASAHAHNQFRKRVERVKIEQEAQEKVKELEEIAVKMRKAMNRAEATMDFEKDPRRGYEVLTAIEAVFRNKSEVQESLNEGDVEAEGDSGH